MPAAMMAWVNASASSVISRAGRPPMIASRFCTSAGSPAEASSMTTWETEHSNCAPSIRPPFLRRLLVPRDEQRHDWHERPGS